MPDFLARVENYRLRVKALGLQPRHLVITERQAREWVACLPLRDQRSRDSALAALRRGGGTHRGMYVRVGPFLAVIGVAR